MRSLCEIMNAIRFGLTVCPLLAVLTFSSLLAVETNTPVSPVFDIPKLDAIKVDGAPDDWGSRGFQVDVLADASGNVRPADNFSPSFRLGWNDEGLLVLVTVVDDVPFESPQEKYELWKGDSVEFFVATERGSGDSYQIVVCPGRDPKRPELQYNISDYRKVGSDPKPQLEATVDRTLTPNGYVIEALLPWKNLNIIPAEGHEIAFQLYANDSDKAGDRYQALWYPQPEANKDTNQMYRLRLSSQPSPSPRAYVHAGYDKAGFPQVSLIAPSYLSGKKVKIKDSCKTVASGKFASEGGWSVMRLNLIDPKESTYGPLTLSIDGNIVDTILMPEPAK